jgi:uncharacterized LabA/DUF88 family protein
LKNIAVLYDIENIVGGYNLKYLSEISLKNIVKELGKNGYENIATQKAYADWSNNKLTPIKWDIAELGIEPIQMYGFSKGAVKNASDIQLVIDALEILHTKPFIETFVLVSGDGGFSSLAKKLSEYGKKVIGCAYRNCTNDIFSKVCDEFIFIDDTLTDEQLNIINNVQMEENKKKQIIENPILKNSIHEVKQIDTKILDIVVKKVEEIISSFENNFDAKRVLTKDGMNISVFKSALNYAIKDFSYIKYGFGKLVDFVRYVIKDTNTKLVLKEPSEYRLMLKSSTLKGFETVEPLLKANDINSYENYKLVLSHQRPVINVPENIDNFYSIIEHFLNNKSDYMNISFDDILLSLGHLNINESEVNKIFYLMVSCNILKGDNSSQVIKEQNYYFKSEDMEEVLLDIQNSIKHKLETTLEGEVINDGIINRIMVEFKK